MKGARVAVIGAGWAGLAAAVTALEHGHQVSLVEAAARPGGRARGLSLRLADTTVQVDNGQHLMIGAYRETLALMERLNVEPDHVLDRHRMQLSSTDGIRLTAAGLPAPWHLAWGLVWARGLSIAERLSLAASLARLRAANWQVPAGCQTVAQWLLAQAGAASLHRRVWEPLCLAMLNTPISEACAGTFARVLRDSLGARREASDFLLPRSTLDAVLPDPAVRWLKERGAKVLLQTPCRSLMRRTGGGWTIGLNRSNLEADRVILALPAPNAARLLEPALSPGIVSPLQTLRHEPIATAWLAWRSPVDLPRMMMLEEDPADQFWGQWLFDRGIQGSATGGVRVAGVVVSAPGRHARLKGDSPADPAGLGQAIARQVSRQLGCAPPDDLRVIVEKRATFACTPNRPRLDPRTLVEAAPGLLLAGDYVQDEYPATLEAAVRSGVAAARSL